MANREGIDLDDAFERMMRKIELRDKNRWTKKQDEGRGTREER
jgi:NTP pyrophosphatase (non-canonical NTP hydrolase)